jgi:hypothetical protein
MHKWLQDRIAAVIDDHTYLGIEPGAKAPLRDALTVAVEDWMRAHPDDVLNICTRKE